jgi:hypothetical protein
MEESLQPMPHHNSMPPHCKGTPVAVPTRANIRVGALNKGGSGDPGVRSAVGCPV